MSAIICPAYYLLETAYFGRQKIHLELIYSLKKMFQLTLQYYRDMEKLFRWQFFISKQYCIVARNKICHLANKCNKRRTNFVTTSCCEKFKKRNIFSFKFSTLFGQFSASSLRIQIHEVSHNADPNPDPHHKIQTNKKCLINKLKRFCVISHFAFFQSDCVRPVLREIRVLNIQVPRAKKTYIKSAKLL